MGDFEFDIKLLISLVETRPLLMDKTDGICKDRIGTKKTRTKVCICPQEDFEIAGYVKKPLLVNIAIIY